MEEAASHPVTPAIGRIRPGRGTLVPVLLFLALALVPVAARFGPEGYILSLVTRAMILGLAAMSLDLVIGYGGLISFGHAAFLGIGAYAVAILSSYGIDDLGLQLVAAILASGLFGFLTGMIALRTRGVYFIMITLAFGQMLFFLATSLASFGGDDGMTLASRSRPFGHVLLEGDVPLYVAVWVVLVAGYLACRMVVASRFGRVLRGARENPVRMEAIGFAPFRFRLVAYVLAGAMAGVAGLLLANQTGFVSPAVMTWQRSGDLIFMVVLGGLGSLHGAIVGALVFLLSEEIMSAYSEHWRIVFGPLLILAVLFARGGLVGIGRRDR